MSKGRAGCLGISGFPTVTFCEGPNKLPSFIQWALPVCSYNVRACAEFQGMSVVCAYTLGVSVIVQGQLTMLVGS